MNPVARLRDSGILLSSRTKQRPDLLETPTGFRVGRLDGICYLGRCCNILDRSTEYLKVVVDWWKQLTMTSTGDLWTRSSALVEGLLHFFKAKSRGLQGLSLGRRTNDGDMKNVVILAWSLTRRSSNLMPTTAIAGRAV